MNFKKFREFLNDRACDGRWSKSDITFLLRIAEDVYKKPWYKRNKAFKNHPDYDKAVDVVNCINNQIYGFNDCNCKKNR